MQQAAVTQLEAEVVDAVKNGTDPRVVADRWSVQAPWVRMKARLAGVDLTPFNKGALLQPDVQWKPSPQAQEVLAAIGWDIDEHVPRRPRCSVRDAELCEMLVLEDLTLAEAGQHFGITRERVRQIVQKHTGLSTRDLTAHREAMREVRRKRVGTDVTRQIAAQDATATLSELAAASGLRAEEVAQVLGDNEALRRRRKNTWSAGVSREAMIAELRRVAALPGGSPLYGPFYEEHRRPESVGLVRIWQKFGTWTAACGAAGVQAPTPPRGDYRSMWTDEELLEWVARCVSDIGPVRSTYVSYDAWAQEHRGGGAPSAQTLRNRLGGWSEILELVADHAELSPPTDLS